LTRLRWDGTIATAKRACQADPALGARRYAGRATPRIPQDMGPALDLGEASKVMGRWAIPRRPFLPLGSDQVWLIGD
jgi:hypothetical protein